MKIRENHLNEAIKMLSPVTVTLDLHTPDLSKPPYSHLYLYIRSESSSFLNKEEKAYLEYLFLVICKAAFIAQIGHKQIDLEILWEIEEKNWELFHANRKPIFRDTLTPLYRNYPEEDALAFAEDSLTELEIEDFLTPPGREYIFITLKTVIDALSQ